LTNEIKQRIKQLGRRYDVLITEIGGTTGDIEGLHFLEAIRQFKQDVGPENVCYVHVTLLPYIKAAEELKTKPTQQSVAKLREIGIEPQILVCRTEFSIPEAMKKKIALFCNVREDSVIEEKERMIVCVTKGREAEVEAIFKKWELHAAVILFSLRVLILR